MPVAGGHVEGELQGAVGAGVHGLFDDGDGRAADAVEFVFDGFVEAVHQAAAAGEDDVLAELVLELGVEGGDEFVDRLDDGVDEDGTGLADDVGDVVHGGLAVDGELGFDLVLGGVDVAELFLEPLDHVDGDLGVGELGVDEFHEFLVDGVAGDGEGDLVLHGGDGAVHAA